MSAFWSCGKSQLMIENPINRCLVITAMVSDMTKNAYGSVTIYIQRDLPGQARESNWLPALDDKAYLVMNLYWLKSATDALSVRPVGKGAGSLPGIVIVK